LSHAEYELDRTDYWTKKNKEEPQSHQYSDYTYSIHTYGVTGRTPCLASLFEEGPTTLVERVVKKPKKTKKKASDDDE
jgi:hypothetical protein